MGDVTQVAVDALEGRAKQIDDAVEGATRSNQERDSAAAQDKEAAEVVEKTGTGTDNRDANTKVLVAALDKKIEIARAAGNTKMVEKFQAQRKAVLNQ